MVTYELLSSALVQLVVHLGQGLLIQVEDNAEAHVAAEVTGSIGDLIDHAKLRMTLFVQLDRFFIEFSSFISGCVSHPDIQIHT